MKNCHNTRELQLDPGTNMVEDHAWDQLPRLTSDLHMLTPAHGDVSVVVHAAVCLPEDNLRW